MMTRKSLSITFAAALLALVGVTAGDAGVDSHRTTRLTFSVPIRLPGMTLAAGTYTIELGAPEMDRNVVRVLSRDRSRLYLTTLTQQVRRPIGPAQARSVRFAETAPGQAPRISAWYPVGASAGHQFIYAR